MRFKELSILLALSTALMVGCDDDSKASDSQQQDQNQEQPNPDQSDQGNNDSNDQGDNDSNDQGGGEPECTSNKCLVSYEEYKAGDELNASYMKCVDNHYVLSECENGTVCIGGSCIDVSGLGESDGCLDQDGNKFPDGTGYCTENGEHAIVCKNGKMTVFTCKQPCSNNEDTGIVSCPKEAAEEETVEKECNPKTYVPTCFNDGANVRVCQKGFVNVWSCNNSDCNVDESNAITCSHVDAEGALHTGGTIGDDCSWTDYTETCGTSDWGPYAVQCIGGKVDVAACGTCTPDEGAKTVTCDGTPECDPSADNAADVFCINENSAIAYCTYSNYWTISRCDNCSKDRIAACMLE